MIAAGLVEVGHGRLSPAKLASILASGDRKLLPEAAPPHGLFLDRVYFENDVEDMLLRWGNLDAG